MYSLTKCLSITMGIALAAMTISGTSRAKGGGVGNPEERVTRDGKRVLRDFVEKAQLVTDNAKYLRDRPGLADLLADIAKVDPDFALQIIEDLLSVTIYETADDLSVVGKDHEPRACPGDTDSDDDRDVPAVRSGATLLVNSDALQEREDEYGIVHESLHKLIPGNTCFEHVRIRALTRYLRDHRSDLNKATVKVRRKSGIANRFIAADSFEESEPYLGRVLATVFRDEGPCEEQQRLRLHWQRYFDLEENVLAILETWTSGSECGPEDRASTTSEGEAIENVRKAQYYLDLINSRRDPPFRDLEKIFAATDEAKSRAELLAQAKKSLRGSADKIILALCSRLENPESDIRALQSNLRTSSDYWSQAAADDLQDLRQEMSLKRTWPKYATNDLPLTLSNLSEALELALKDSKMQLRACNIYAINPAWKFVKDLAARIF